MQRRVLVDIVILDGAKFFLERGHLCPLASVIHSSFDRIRDDFQRLDGVPFRNCLQFRKSNFQIVHYFIIPKQQLRQLKDINKIIDETVIIEFYCQSIKIIARMNKSFDFVMNCALNRSKSKEAHLFAQAKRFAEPRTPHCKKDSYDLSKTMIATTALQSKSTIFTKDDRFKPNRSVSPSPNAYHHRSFVDLNSSIERGTAFGNEQKLRRVDKMNTPGPGSYQQTYNPEKKLSYTMRNRLNVKDHSSKLGPGQYQIEGYSSVTQFNQVHSKYNNIKSTVVGRDTRFKDKWHITPGPGPTAHSNSRVEIGRDPQYSFGGSKKDSTYIKKTITPGPGSYNQFSQFAELRKGGSTIRSSHVN